MSVVIVHLNHYKINIYMIIIYSSMISPILYHGANLMVKFRGPHQPNSIQ